MTAAPDRTRLVEDLRRAMDELCSPELTLARAEALRPDVARILRELRAEAPSPRERSRMAEV